jgi:sugar lactone lactonase YvrE
MIRKAWTLTALLLVSLATSRLTAQEQYGPPASGNTSAILFAPATLNLVAGSFTAGYGGDGGPANSATTMLSAPIGIAYDSNGNLFIADSANHVVRRIDHGTGDISTFAGQQANPGFSIGGGVATSAQMQSPSGLVVDSNNNVYVADRSNNVVFKITPTGVISIFAGSGTIGYGGDGGSATAAAAKFSNIWALGIDSSNNIYIADTGNNLIRKVTQAGNLSTFAGDVADVSGCSSNQYSTGAPPYTALQVHLCFPQGVAFDSLGNAYITDTKNDVIYKVDSSGNLTLFAGTYNTPGFSGDAGPATSAWFDLPAGLYTDPAGRVYISDFFSGRIRVVDTLGNINTVFGDGFGSLNKSSIGEPDTEATNVTSGPANGIYDFVLDQEGNIIATDSSSNAVTSAGSTGQYVFPEQFVFDPSLAKYVTVENPSGVPLDFLGTPTITGPYSLATGASAGTCNFSGTLPAGETCTIGIIFTPIVDDPKNQGSLTLTTNANSSPSTISLFGMSYGTGTTSATLTGAAQSFTAVVGQTSASQAATLTNTGQEPITVTSTSFGGGDPAVFAIGSTTCPTSPATLASGATCVFNLTFTPTNTVTESAAFNVTIANYGQIGVVLDGVGTAAGAPVAGLTPATVPFGNVTAATTSASMQLKLSNTGNATLSITGISIVGANPSDFAISTGSNACGSSLALDATCFIYVTFTPASASSFTATLQVADNASGSPQSSALTGTGTPVPAAQVGQLQFTPSLISLFAGGGQCSRANPITPGPAINEPICGATAVVTDSKGNEYILDQDYNSVYKVDPSGNLTVYAGVPTIGNGSYGGDNGPAVSALLASPIDIVVDSSDNLYISDYGNSRIRMVNATTGKITTFAGFGKLGFFTPGTTATAPLGGPQGMTFDPSGNLYVSNGFGMLVLKIDTSLNVTVFAGQQVTSGSSAGEGIAGYAGDGGQSINATLSDPNGLASDQQGNIYIADSNNYVIRKVDTSGKITTYAGNHTQGNSGDNGPATSAEINAYGVSADLAGDIYITGGINCFGANCANVVREVNTSGTISTYAGGGTGTVPGPATGVALTTPYFARIDNNGDLIIPTGQTVESAGPQGILQFGSESVGVTSSPLTLTLTNTGDGTLVFAGVPGMSDAADTFCDGACLITGDFAVLGGTCNFTSLTPGTSCTLTITFTPSQAGSRTGVLTLATFAPDGETTVTETVQLSGTGAAAAAPAASLSPSTLNFGGVQIDATSPPLVEVVTNTGGGSLNISGVTIAQTGDTVYFLSTGANQCTNATSLSAGQSCNVYVTFKPAVNNQTSNATLQIADNAPPSPQTASLTGVGDYFYEPVGSSSSMVPVSVFITTGGTLSATNVVTAGAHTQDYVVQSGGTCATGSAYTAGQVCTVDVIFTPQYSGARNGSIYLADASGNVLGTTFLQGTGDGPQMIFGPVAPQSVTGYITGLAGVAVDAADDLFYVNGSDKLIEVPASGPAVTVVNLDSLLGGVAPNNVAIDSSGNLFIASNSSTPLIEVPTTGIGTWGAPVSINTGGVANVADVVVDNLGNVYIVAPAQNAVLQLPLTAGGYGTPVPLPFPGSGAFKPEGVAVDLYLDVYAIGQQTSNNQTEVIYLPANNNGYGTAQTIPLPQLTYGNSVGTDGNGNLYVAGLTSPTNGGIYFVPISGAPVPVGAGLYYNFTLDGASNIYTVEANSNDQAALIEIPQATPPSLTFASTNVGATSTDSPKTISVTNVGNEQLNFYSSSSYPTDFPENISDDNVCNAEFPLSAGAKCDVSVDFTPTTAGSLSEAVTLKDENLNSQASQSIQVSGTATGAAAPGVTLTPSLAFPGTQVGTTSSTLSATLTNTGNATLSITGITIGGANSSDFAIATGGNACGTTLAANASCSIYVTFTPASAASFSSTLSVADNATGSPQTSTITGTGTAPPAPVATLAPNPVAFASQAIGATSAATTVTLTNTGNATLTITSISITGANPTDFATTSGSSSCDGSISAGASCNIYVTFTPASGASFLATLSVADNAAGSPQTVALSGSGINPADFNVSATPASQTVQPGGSTTFNVSVASSGGTFTNPVALTVSGLPAGATGSFSPSSITPGSESATSTLTVQTGTGTQQTARNSAWPLAAPVLAAVGLFFVPGKRRRRWITLGALLLASLGTLTALSGCGGGFSFVQPSQTYTLTITGASGDDTHSTTVQLTVQ